MANNPTEPKSDPFVQLSLDTWSSLNVAFRELGWIADGGDPSATPADRDMANLKRIEYDRERNRVMQRLTAYMAQQLSVTPPSALDLENSKNIAARLAQMRDVNVTVTAVINAATELLNLYHKA